MDGTWHEERIEPAAAPVVHIEATMKPALLIAWILYSVFLIGGMMLILAPHRHGITVVCDPISTQSRWTSGLPCIPQR